jgi:hypothetical protein
LPKPGPRWSTTPAKSPRGQALAFYALTDADVQAPCARIRDEYWNAGEPVPSFEEVELPINREIESAAMFLVNLLMGR